MKLLTYYLQLIVASFSAHDFFEERSASLYGIFKPQSRPLTHYVLFQFFSCKFVDAIFPDNFF